MDSSNKSFVKLHGPINLSDSDSESDECELKHVSILKNKTPENTKKTPTKTPKTEVKLSDFTMTPNSYTTPHRDTQKRGNSSFTPLSPVPTPKQQYDKLMSTTIIEHDEGINYSRILQNKSPIVAKNTRDATIGETYRKLYRDNKDKNRRLLHQKSQLEIEFRRFKLENQLALAKQREDNAKTEKRIPEMMEKLQRKVDKSESKLLNLQVRQETDEKFKEIVRINSKVKEERNSIKEVNEGIKVLNNLMNYSVDANDIDGIVLTNKFEGEIGEKFKELLSELKAVLPKLEPNI